MRYGNCKNSFGQWLRTVRRFTFTAATPRHQYSAAKMRFSSERQSGGSAKKQSRKKQKQSQKNRNDRRKIWAEHQRSAQTAQALNQTCLMPVDYPTLEAGSELNPGRARPPVGHCWLRVEFVAPGVVLPANLLFWNVATVVPTDTLIPMLLLNMSVLDSRIVAVPLNPDTPVPLLLTI